MNLKKGDLIDIIAPSFSCSEIKLNKAVSLLKTYGFKPKIQKDILKKDFLFASSKQNRILGFKKALYSKSKAIISLRGGYGAIHLAQDFIMWPGLKTRSNSKIFVGSSDATIIHILLNNYGFKTLYSPMLSRLAEKKYLNEFIKLISILEGKTKVLNFKNLKPINLAGRKKKLITGKIVGGNLCTLIGSIGTPWQIKLTNKILFLEDVNEEGYQIDRMLYHMLNAGLFKNIKGIILGDFVHKSDRNIKKVIDDFFKKANFCVVGGIKVGHNKKTQEILPFNVNATLETGTRPSLSLSLK